MFAPDVGDAFDATMDQAYPAQYYISALLERGIKVLIYVGANDWICNWVCISCYAPRKLLIPKL